MSQYDNDIHVGSGLGSGSIMRYQRPLRDLSRRVAQRLNHPVTFHPSNSGFENWEAIADALIRRHQIGKKVTPILVGHSNFVFAITAIAYRLQYYGIKCRLIALDTTLKDCPPLLDNVTHAVDVWAQLSNLTVAMPAFRNGGGILQRYNFGDLSHVGVIYDNKVMQLVEDTMLQWAAELGFTDAAATESNPPPA